MWKLSKIMYRNIHGNNAICLIVYLGGIDMRMRFREIKECKYEQAERNVVNTTYADSERPSDIPQPPMR